MAAQLPEYKQTFLRTIIGSGVLGFGSFQLKSGRISPYFFNTGKLHTSRLAGAVSTAFAQAILDAQQNPGLEFDVVFGPAYKGIPLCASVVVKLGELAPDTLDSVSYSFDRKEAKDHAEGGVIVGASLKGKRVLIIDDTITDGGGKRGAIETVQREQGTVVGLVVALDRMETAKTVERDDPAYGLSALGLLEKDFGFPAFSILTLDDIIQGAGSLISEQEMERLEQYRDTYKATPQGK